MTLTSQPSSQKPAFISGCAKGEKTATCTVSSVTDKQPVSLDAQVPVAAGATSVSSVTLTATASIVTSAKWTPPAADETVAVISASASAATAATPAASAPAETVLPLGPVPALNGVSSSLISSSLIGAGNASSLFPAISPSATPSPSPSPGANAQITEQNAAPDADSSTPAPVLPAQVAGLIALAVGIMLTVTRLSLRKRFRSPKNDA